MSLINRYWKMSACFLFCFKNYVWLTTSSVTIVRCHCISRAEMTRWFRHFALFASSLRCRGIHSATCWFQWLCHIPWFASRHFFVFFVCFILFCSSVSFPLCKSLCTRTGTFAIRKFPPQTSLISIPPNEIINVNHLHDRSMGHHRAMFLFLPVFWLNN